MYNECGMCLTKNQIKKLDNAAKKGKGIDIKFSNKNLRGNMKIPLTTTQKTKVEKALKNSKGVTLTFSKSQLKAMEKKGGFLPLLALIPGLIGAAGGLAGGIASAVNSSKQTAEMQRHNKAIENKLGQGIVSNAAAYIPIIGKQLSVLLKKVGLGQNYWAIKVGHGLYLEPYNSGSGLHLQPKH